MSIDRQVSVLEGNLPETVAVQKSDFAAKFDMATKFNLATKFDMDAVMLSTATLVADRAVFKENGA